MKKRERIEELEQEVAHLKSVSMELRSEAHAWQSKVFDLEKREVRTAATDRARAGGMMQMAFHLVWTAIKTNRGAPTE